MSSNTYSVAALAAALNVPRTTVNDWLAKYENFIDASAVGKRKVYSEQTLAVLQEVARLRDQGKTGAEIELALEQSHGVTPEITPEKGAAETAVPNPAPEPEKVNAVPDNDNQSQLPAVKKFEENAMELANFIAELRKEQVQSRKRSRLTAFMLFIVIIVLAAALAAAVHTVRMQFAERKLEAAKMQQTLEKLNSDFSSELKAQEKLRQQERLAAEQNAALLKNELIKLQQANAAEVKRLSNQLIADRKAMQKELAQQEKSLKNKSDSERKLLLEKMAKDSAEAQARLDALKNELAAANQALALLNKKLDTPPAPPAPAPASAPAAANPEQTPPAPGAAGK